MPTLRLSDFCGSPWPCFDEEPEPRTWLLSGMLADHSSDEDIEMFRGEIAKAEAGEPNVVIGNHHVWVIMSPDKVIVEEMLYGDEKTNGTVPKRTEISLAETKQLVLDWREAIKRWHAEHRPVADAVACERSGPK